MGHILMFILILIRLYLCKYKYFRIKTFSLSEVNHLLHGEWRANNAPIKQMCAQSQNHSYNKYVFFLLTRACYWDGLVNVDWKNLYQQFLLLLIIMSSSTSSSCSSSFFFFFFSSSFLVYSFPFIFIIIYCNNQ